MATVLGIDIGGSTSRARLVRDGELAAEAKASSASLVAAGPDAASQALDALLSQLPDAGAGLDAVCAGAAGLSAGPARDLLHARLAPLTSSGTVLIVDDASLILPAAGRDDGIAVICGTGSIAVGASGGRRVRAGGWGYLLGDEGSGYWIVRTAVRTLLDRHAAGQPPGPLGETLLAAAGLPGPEALHPAFLARPQPRFWARYAPAVLDSADPAAAQLTDGAAAALAALAAAAAAALAAPAPPDVVLAGGLMGHDRLRAATAAAITAAMPGSQVTPLTEPPVAGAVALATAAARDRQA